MDNSTPDYNDLLIRYLDNDLDAESKQEVRNLIESDPVVREQYEDLQLAREAVRQYGLRSRVSEIHREMRTEMKVPVRKISAARRNFRYGMSIAAGLLLIFGAYFLYNFFTLSADRMFASHYQPYEPGTFRGETPAAQGIKAFKEKNYEELDRIYKNSDSSDATAFLVAMARIEQADFTDAIPLLEKLSGDTSNSLKEESEYYLALSYIKNRDFDLAIPLLEKINRQESHLYHEKVSRKMIRQVKMLKWR